MNGDPNGCFAVVELRNRGPSVVSWTPSEESRLASYPITSVYVHVRLLRSPGPDRVAVAAASATTTSIRSDVVAMAVLREPPRGIL